MREKLENMLLSDMDIVADIVREVNSYSGSLEFLEVHDMEEFDWIAEGYSPSEIANMIHYGNFSPVDPVFRFDGYGNLESLSSWEVEDEYRTYIDEIIDALLDVKDNICLPKELELILNLYDFEEEEE